MNRGTINRGLNKEVSNPSLHFKKSLDYSRLFLCVDVSDRTTDCGLIRVVEPPQPGSASRNFFRKFQEIIFNFLEDFLYL